ncbi:MAG: hypothetical protein ACC613_01250 [Synergistales bacterium]
MSSFSDRAKLALLIETLVTIHPRGLKILLGEAPNPTCEDIAETFFSAQGEDLGVRIQVNRDRQDALNLLCKAQVIQDLVDLAGGWEGLQAATREVREVEALAWNLFADSVRWVHCGSRLNNGTGYAVRIAERYNVSVRTAVRWRPEIPKIIARIAMMR